MDATSRPHEIGTFCARLYLAGREVGGIATSRGVARLARGWDRQTAVMDAIEWPWDAPDWESLEVPEGIPDPRKAKVAVFLLGPIRVFRGGQLVRGGWRTKTLELLAFLGVHPHGAAKDQILEALWPERDPRQTQKYLWRTVSDLRCRLRGPSPMRIVIKEGDAYRLDLRDVWVDALAFEAAACKGHRAESVPCLYFACDIYKGEFCEGRYFTWSSLMRERLTLMFIQSARALACSLGAEGKPAEAVTILDKATYADPFDEDLCRMAMVLDARLGRVDRAARRWRRLRRLFLEEFRAEPSDATAATFTELGGNPIGRFGIS